MSDYGWTKFSHHIQHSYNTSLDNAAGLLRLHDKMSGYLPNDKSAFLHMNIVQQSQSSVIQHIGHRFLNTFYHQKLMTDDKIKYVMDEYEYAVQKSINRLADASENIHMLPFEPMLLTGFSQAAQVHYNIKPFNGGADMFPGNKQYIFDAACYLIEDVCQKASPDDLAKFKQVAVLYTALDVLTDCQKPYDKTRQAIYQHQLDILSVLINPQAIQEHGLDITAHELIVDHPHLPKLLSQINGKGGATPGRMFDYAFSLN